MRHLMLLGGQEDNYRSSELYIEHYLRVKADDSQIHRLCEHYGGLLEGESRSIQGAVVSSSEALLKQVGEGQVVYAMSDGCQLPTRPVQSEEEEIGSWKEMKLGRLFLESEHIALEKKPNQIRQSLYVSHFGKHDVFTDKFEQVVDVFEPLNQQLVFINDGASWIENWISSRYPQATNILDFYHAMEYLHTFSKAIFPKKEEQTAKDQWVEQQKNDLLEDKVETLIERISQMELRTKKQLEAQHKILTYYGNHQHRMRYKTYLDRGLLIGSGPIESAHRFVLQKRMKQSGQKWTKKGGQAVANLRVVHLNKQWNRVISMINQCHQKAA